MIKKCKPSSFRLYLLLLFVLVFSMGAQGQTVSGVVTSADDNQPIIGASVVAKNGGNGTTTDFDGNFEIDADSDDVLVFSYVGFKTVEVPVNGRSTLNVSMEVDVAALDEVVVVGYGTQRKADVTAAVSEVDLSTLENVPVANASRLIQGQAAGVQVNQLNGSPGQELQIRVRGNGSLGASNDPLYVIDGFPIGNSIGQTLNPNDIESITILKDAASTSIYGARGSNGVVLITTKGAKEGVSRMSISMTQGLQTVPDSRKIDVLNAQQFVQFQNERISENFRRANGVAPSPDDIPLAWRFPNQAIPSTNWFNEILNNSAFIQDINFNISNGTKKVKTSLSLGYFNQEGTIIGTDFDRITTRLNLSSELNDYISVNWNISGTLTENNNPGALNTGNFTTSVINTAYLADPRDPVYNEDGSFNQYIGGRDGVFGYPNPVQRLSEEINRTNQSILLTNGSISIKPAKGFKFESIVNASLTNTRNRQYSPSTIPNWNVPPPKVANGSESSATILNYGWDNLLSYETTLDKHKIDATIGYVVQKETVNQLSGSGTQFPNDLIPYISGAPETLASSNVDDWGLVAFFGRLNYNYDDRYLFSASYRREGSSRFGANNKWGDFPAFSAGWRISNEEFFPENNFLTDLKLRTSWGVTGNNNIGNYTHLARLSATNYVLGGQLVGGQTLLNFGNPDLTWETSRQLDIGLDFKMFNNKIGVVAEYYRRTTEDMLLPVQVPAISGFNTALTNIGKVENKGVEIALNYKDRFGDFGLSTNFNIAFNRNEILEINNDVDEIFTSNNYYGANNIYRVGEPIGMLYGFVVDGIFETEEEIAAGPSHPGNTIGTYRYRDVNGDGEITYDTQDWDIIGDPNPDFTWGLNINMDYKNFDLSLGFLGAQGYDVYRNVEHFIMNVDGVFNTSTKMIDRWRSPENPGVGGWAGTGNFQFTREASSRFVFDGSHIWFRNITLGYNLPKFSDKFSVRLYGTVENVALITDYPGNNPEANSGDPLNPQIVTIGVDNDTYPVPRIFSVGLNLNF